MQKFGGMEALDAPYMEISFGHMIRKRAPWLCALFLSEMLTATGARIVGIADDRAAVPNPSGIDVATAVDWIRERDTIVDCPGAEPIERSDLFGLDCDVLVSRSEEHTSELQSPCNLVCRLLLEIGRASCRERV